VPGEPRPQIKFCGLTRHEDALAAATAGGAYLGVIFAGGPRLVTAAQARTVLAGLSSVRRVGVFGAQPAEAIGAAARAAGLDVVQLHGDPDAASVEAARAHFGGEVWAVVRIADDRVPEHLASLFAAADAVVIDAFVPGALGGTGRAVPWDAVRPALDRARSAGLARTVLAGGLTPGNVATAIRHLAPDIVDVSSGVESAPGIKDPALLHAFGEAVRTSTRET